ncbi:MAG TPA: diguanylate cyclase [Candidatus Eisenbacteria bacterium]|jgi:diguanylate cyclase (GGDEF)-like protein|nr:diguanylate cyclase [Candidatus Eisenbacteria bacterium]
MDKKTVLLAADESGFPPAMRAALAEAGYDVFAAGLGVLEQARGVRPDVILLDAGPGTVDVRGTLAADEETASIPVIFLTTKDTASSRWKELAQATDDFVSRPFDAAEILGRIEAALGRRRFYQKISTTDELTGFHNPHVYRKEIFILFNIARRYRRPFSLAVLDIDGLRSVNESFGRLAGDFVLRTFAGVMRRVFRQPDVLIRMGEDEFVVLMPESGSAQAAVALKRFESELRREPFEAAGAPPLTVTFSSGVAEYSEAFLSENDLFDLACRKLKLEKAAKRSSPGGGS